MTESKPSLPEIIGPWARPSSPRIVTEADIFDYMNGAGELYLGYRFDRLEVFEYAAQDRPDILVELYFMQSPDDAFGLLSLDWGGEPMDLRQDPPVPSPAFFPPWPRALYGEGMLRLCAGSVYARILASQETPESRENVLALGQSVVKDRARSPLPEFFQAIPDSLPPGWTLQGNRAGYCRTHLVLNSLYYLGQGNLLALGHNTEAVTAPYEHTNASGTKKRIQYLSVRHPDPGTAGSALEQFHGIYLPEIPLDTDAKASERKQGIFSLEDGWMGYKLQGATIVFIFEGPDKETLQTIFNIR